MYYSFQRIVRGIPVDVWVAEKNSNPNNNFQSNDGGKEYQTTELYFSRNDWKILVGEINARQSLPIGMSTFIAHSVKYMALLLLTIKMCRDQQNSSKIRVLTFSKICKR